MSPFLAIIPWKNVPHKANQNDSLPEASLYNLKLYLVQLFPSLIVDQLLKATGKFVRTQSGKHARDSEKEQEIIQK